MGFPVQAGVCVCVCDGLNFLQMSNSEKIDTELAERIRVVSGQQSFSFPIWFANIVVGVRVGKGSSIYATPPQYNSYCIYYSCLQRGQSRVPLGS